MVTVGLALLAGVSAAFAAWLCCVAYSDVVLTVLPIAPGMEDVRRYSMKHERSA